MKRKDALEHIKVAGYHGDSRGALRIYTEARISHSAYTAAYAAGQRLKNDGVACGCIDCRRK